MSTVPKADAILTPAQYGAVAPDGRDWPLNAHNRTAYAINRLYPTVQGEGVNTGVPMTIVRMQGCPVGCVFCDTPESWATPLVPAVGQWKTAGEVAQQVAAAPPLWALVTGGEPCWHDLEALTRELLAVGRRTALETSGVYRITGRWNHITVSPKPKGLLPIRPHNLQLADEVKWLIGRQEDVTDLELFLEQHGLCVRADVFCKPQVTLQPISCSRRATDIALEALMAHPTWRLSIQTHKEIRIA